EEVVLAIPAEAFQQADGTPVSGELELKVRLLDNPADLFLSGRMMNQEQQSWTAPLMLEVLASQNGSAVSLSQPMEVRYLNCQMGESAQWATLSEADGNWQLLPLPEAEVNWLAPDESLIGPRPAAPEWLAMDNPDELVPKSMGMLPQKPGKPFGVKVKNLANYPQFRGYEQMYWEYLEGAGSANPWEEGLIGQGQGWEDVRVRPKTDRNSYELRFGRKTDSGLEFKIVEALPMFEARSQAEADQLYQKRYREYREAVAAREAALQQDQALQAEQVAELKAYEEAVAAWEAASQDSVQVCEQIVPFQQLGLVGIGLPTELDLSGQTLTFLQPDGESLDASLMVGHLYFTFEGAGTFWQAPVEAEQVLLPEQQGPLILWLGHPDQGIWRAYWEAGQTEVVFEALPEFEVPQSWLVAPLAGKKSELN
ncbi:MAG: hypothetical protein AAF399_00090, partial [Bacteroidota bacterium]